MATVNARHLVPIALVATCWLGSSVATIAQSAWPTAKKTAVVQRSSPDARRKPARSGAAPAASRRAKRTPGKTSQTATADHTTLRAMSEIIARQTLAIEALAVRLEAAERRLDMATALALAPDPARLKPDTTEQPDTPDPPADDLADPFRPNRAVDWAQVLEGLVP